MTVLCPLNLSSHKVLILNDVFMLEPFGNIKFSEKWRKLFENHLLITNDMLGLIYKIPLKSFDRT